MDDDDETIWTGISFLSVRRKSDIVHRPVLIVTVQSVLCPRSEIPFLTRLNIQ